MKKLRASESEKETFIRDIIDLISRMKSPIEEISIDSLKKEYSKIPEEVIKPEITVTAEAYLKMLEMVNQSSVECSWHGLVSKIDNKYLIYDILVFPQINSATSTTTDEKEFAEWQTKLILDPEFPIENLRLHGHSHVNMNVFSSGVDDQYQKDLIAKVEDGDYYIFFIMNKKMELCIFLYDFEQQIMFETSDITLHIGDIDIRQWAIDELEQNATTSRTYPAKTGYRQSRWDDEDYDYGYSYFGNTKPIFKGVGK